MRKFTKETRLFDCGDGGIVRYCPALAEEIGEKESILLLQLEYWLVTLEGREKDGKKWIYKSMGDIQERFPSWGHKTVFRILKSLEASGYISSRDDLNKRKKDRTRWYSINFDPISQLTSLTIERTQIQERQKEPILAQKEPILAQKEPLLAQKEPTLPEIPTEITKENSEKKKPNFLIEKIPYPTITPNPEEDVLYLEESDIPSLEEILSSSPISLVVPPSPQICTVTWRRCVFMFCVQVLLERYKNQSCLFNREKWQELMGAELYEQRKYMWGKWGNIPLLPHIPLTGAEKFSKLQELKQKHEKLYGTCS